MSASLAEHPLYGDWQYEVTNGDTCLGFREWLEHKEESESEE